MFAVIILRKKLLVTQWASLVILIAGVALVQLADQKEAKAVTHEQSRLIGFAAVLGACFLSGLAGIYFEKMLKGADISVWMRNVQMSLLSLPISIVMCFASDHKKILNGGFFQGYDLFVVYLIALNAVGGLLVAMVVKYADNILKGFATSLAIIISCVASVYLFDFRVTFQFIIGAALVISSIFAYGWTPKPKEKTELSTPSLKKIDDEAMPRELEPLDQNKPYDKV